MRQDRARNQKKAIGIIGGVGPEAGCILHQYLIQETQRLKGAKKDQDHIETFHLALPQMISDRTGFLAHNVADNPADGAFEVAKLLEALAVIRQEEVIVGVPCNTFHVPEIYKKFEMLVEENNLSHLKLVNMIEETIIYIRKQYPKIMKVGVLSTTGTRQSHLYKDALVLAGYDVLQVPEKMQSIVHQSIYDPDWGIKAISPVSSQARKNFYQFAELLVISGAEIIILGCTEIPLVFKEQVYQSIPLVDPMKVLAYAIVNEV